MENISSSFSRQLCVIVAKQIAINENEQYLSARPWWINRAQMSVKKKNNYLINWHTRDVLNCKSKNNIRDINAANVYRMYNVSTEYPIKGSINLKSSPMSRKFNESSYTRSTRVMITSHKSYSLNEGRLVYLHTWRVWSTFRQTNK